MLPIPEFAVEILNTLNSAGFEAYAVGGCVRDAIIGTVPTDVDIATSATQEQIHSLFPASKLTGGRFFTVTVSRAGGKAEITPFRKEGGYSDSRRPDEVNLASDLSEDLKRRDFTVNSICFDGKNIIDPLNGKADIKAGIIRCVGEPERRFDEDALRIMRAFRFSAELGFEIEPRTMAAALSCSRKLQSISVERIRDELIKIALSPEPERVSTLFECGALAFLKLSASPLLPKLKTLTDDAETRLSALFDICGREAVETLKLPTRLKRVIQAVFCALDSFPPPAENAVKRAMNRFTAEAFAVAAEIADRLYGKPAECSRLCELILDSGEPYLISHLALNGTDLKNAGVQDKDIGSTLNELLEKVFDSPESNTRRKLSELLTKLKK